MDGAEGVWVESQSGSVRSQCVCSLAAVLRIELLLPGRGGNRGIPGKPWNSWKAVEFRESRGIPGRCPLQHSQQNFAGCQVSDRECTSQLPWPGLPVPKGFSREEGRGLADRALSKADSERISCFIWNFYTCTHQSLGN